MGVGGAGGLGGVRGVHRWGQSEKGKVTSKKKVVSKKLKKFTAKPATVLESPSSLQP